MLARISGMETLTFGELKNQLPEPPRASVKDEIRSNLMDAIRRRSEIFPGIHGYDESVIPALINALLSKHNLILLGLRGQAKSRILRSLTRLLDKRIPVVAGCEIHCSPYAPICARCCRKLREEGERLEVEWLDREQRYVEKLATPDVTIADMIGDLDPIRAARTGRDLSSQENIQFGLLPRAHRGIFAINELPDLAPKIQVGLFNIMQEGDVQIKGFPIRFPLDVLLAFSANPEDYTARGKIITPLKDRIGSEIKTHYPETLGTGMKITGREAWTERSAESPSVIPDYVREIVEGIAFEARQDRHIDSSSGVSQRLPISCLENCLSNAERRRFESDEEETVVRVVDIYAALPAITGKLELEYEGELQGAEKVAERLILQAVRKTFEHHFSEAEFDRIVTWFELGGQVRATDQTPSREYLEKIASIQGLLEIIRESEIDEKTNPERAASLIEFILEGLCAQKRLSRTPERGYFHEGETVREDILTEITARRN